MADALAPLPPPTSTSSAARFRGEVITPAARPYDDARRLWNAVHDLRPARHRASDERRRGRDRDPVRPRPWARDRRPVGRPQPVGPLERERRPRHRPVRDARRRGGPGGPDGARERRRAPGRARRRRAGARARVPGRRRRPHGRRGAHARWRRRPAAAAVRPHAGQRRRGRARHRRRPGRPGERDRGAGPVLGRARRRLELRRS